jgi:Carbohydrate/starch-binding module (family 21)
MAGRQTRITDMLVRVQNVDIIKNEVRVAILCSNVAYEKKVTVRWSSDNWATFSDAEADYLNSENLGIDKFEGLLDISKIHESHAHIQLAVRYICAGIDVWDNNSAENYQVNQANFR